jgi:hypothetical protein
VIDSGEPHEQRGKGGEHEDELGGEPGHRNHGRGGDFTDNGATDDTDFTDFGMAQISKGSS